jgi:hypothetical protein
MQGRATARGIIAKPLQLPVQQVVDHGDQVDDLRRP